MDAAQPLRRGTRKHLGRRPSSALTIVFTLLGLFAYQQLLNFIFSEETNWNSVRVNLRLLFTQAYPESDYHRVWIARPGPHPQRRGPRPRVGQGISMKKIATWCVGWGGLVVLGVFLRQPSVLVGDDGTPFSPTPTVCPWRDGLGTLVYLDGSPAPSQGCRSLRVLRRCHRQPQRLAPDRSCPHRPRCGDLVRPRRQASPQQVPSGHSLQPRRYRRPDPRQPGGTTGATTPSPPTRRRASAASTSNQASRWPRPPATHGPSCSWSSSGPTCSAGSPERLRAQAQGLLTLGWFLAPFITFFAILRGPEFDWGYVAAVDVPLWLAFGIGGAADVGAHQTRHRRTRSGARRARLGHRRLHLDRRLLRLVRHAPEGAAELPAARPRCAARPELHR